MQTLSILSRIRLAWPSSARTVMNVVLVTNVQLEGARPECLIRSPTFPSYHVYTISIICAPLSILLAINAARWLYHLSRSFRKSLISSTQFALTSTTLDDQLELVESIMCATLIFMKIAIIVTIGRSCIQMRVHAAPAVSHPDQSSPQPKPQPSHPARFCSAHSFHFWVVMSWSKIFSLIISPDSDDGDTRTLTQIGFGVAIGLLVLEALLMLKYFTNTRAVIKQQEPQRRSSLWSRVSVDRLAYRIRYMTKRFASHAQYWQFVVWGVRRTHHRACRTARQPSNPALHLRARSLRRTAGSSLPRYCPAPPCPRPARHFLTLQRQFLLELVALFPTLINSSASSRTIEPGQLEEAGVEEWVIWLHSSLALLVIGAFAVYHRRVYPYFYPFQNQLEDWLFLASGMMIFFGLVYTFLDRKVRRTP